MMCAIHQKEMKQNSKGWYCPTPVSFTPDHKQVTEWCQWKPGAEDQKPNYTPSMEKTAEQIREKVEDKPDWEEIALGKIRHGVAVAYIEKGSVLSDRIKEEINAWTEFIKSGK